MTRDIELLRQARRWCSDGTARQLIEDSGATQTWFASRVCTNQATLSRWLSGQRLPRSNASGLRFARQLDRLASATESVSSR